MKKTWRFWTRGRDVFSEMRERGVQRGWGSLEGWFGDTSPGDQDRGERGRGETREEDSGSLLEVNDYERRSISDKKQGEGGYSKGRMKVSISNYTIEYILFLRAGSHILDHWQPQI